MRSFVLASVIGATLLGLPGVSQAQLKIDARVGFPIGGKEGHKFKIGCWAPVYVDLKNDTDNTLPALNQLVVEAPDSDDVTGEFAVKGLPAIPAHSQERILTYTRLGTTTGDIKVSLKDPDGRRVLASFNARGSIAQDALSPGSALYLVAGKPVPGELRAAVAPHAGAGSDRPESEFASVSQVQDLPTRWFGYQGVDLVILMTSRQQFVDDLTGDTQDRLKALGEWVRRGGRLVLCGSDARLAGLWKKLAPELEVTGLAISDRAQAEWDRLRTVEDWARPFHEGKERLGDFVPLNAENKTVRVALLELTRRDLKQARDVDVVVPRPGQNVDRTDRPLIVEVPCGLGRVLVIAFDLDEAPFTGWNGQLAFWKKLNQVVGTRVENLQVANQSARPGRNVDYKELGSRLQDSLESFDDVPVISFGWVALFILLYIAVVGPLDYWFLKRVLKRLELTWITFPAVVLTISIAAYFTAYYLKGSDLRINKVDVIDLVAQPDADNSQVAATHVYGSTWFTLFSPHIKNYTVGIEPAAPGWAIEPPGKSDNPYATLVSTMGRPENVYGGVGGRGSGGLFRRSYQYEPDSGGIVGVPVQVWSTKTFAASWQAALPRGNKLFTASLSVDARGVHGWIENGLPVPLQDVVVFYGGAYFTVGDLPRQARKEVTLRTELGGGSTNLEKLFQPSFFGAVKSVTPGSRRSQMGSGEQVSAIISRLLFYSADRNKDLRNSSVRDLDQGWRLPRDSTRSQEEAVVYGRVQPTVGGAEDVTQSGSSPTRLWLDQLPGGDEARTKLSGNLSQETYVRVYLPILKKP